MLYTLPIHHTVLQIYSSFTVVVLMQSYKAYQQHVTLYTRHYGIENIYNLTSLSSTLHCILLAHFMINIILIYKHIFYTQAKKLGNLGPTKYSIVVMPATQWRKFKLPRHVWQLVRSSAKISLKYAGHKASVKCSQKVESYKRGNC